MGPRTILVDGYNVIRNIAGLASAERASLEHGRDQLIIQLVQRYRHTPHRVVVVFDGDGEFEQTQPIRGLRRGQVIYTCYRDSADTVIARVACSERAAGEMVVVATNDIEVRDAVTHAGGQAAGISEMAQRLNQPDKYQQRQARHRAALRRVYEPGEDAYPAPPRKGNPRRSPRRRGSRGEPLV